jgi:hypothetical protein
MAILLVDGAPLRICAPYCLTRWSKDGTFLFVFLWRSRREPVRGEAWQFPRSGGKPAGSSRGKYLAAGRPERGSWSRIGWARSTGVGQGPRALCLGEHYGPPEPLSNLAALNPVTGMFRGKPQQHLRRGVPATLLVNLVPGMLLVIDARAGLLPKISFQGYSRPFRSSAHITVFPAR